MSRLSHLLSVEVPQDPTRPRGPMSDLRRYNIHRGNAKHRGIAFELTFD